MRKPHRYARRSGVILMVCLALLTLFAIVGLTFVAYSESSRSARLNFQKSRWFTHAQEARSVASVVQRDLVEALVGVDFDFSTSRKAIACLRTSAAALQELIRQARDAEQNDPKEESLLEQLSKLMEEETLSLRGLELLISQIELSPKEDAG